MHFQKALLGWRAAMEECTAYLSLRGASMGNCSAWQGTLHLLPGPAKRTREAFHVAKVAQNRGRLVLRVGAGRRLRGGAAPCCSGRAWRWRAGSPGGGAGGPGQAGEAAQGALQSPPRAPPRGVRFLPGPALSPPLSRLPLHPRHSAS